VRGAVLLCLATTTLCPAQDRGKDGKGSNKRPNPEQQLEQARSSVTSARQALQAAGTASAAAEQSLRTAGRELRETEEKARDKHSKAPEFVRAKAARDAARDEYERISQPVLDTLHETTEYEAALRDAQDARRKLEASRSDTSLTEERRMQKAKDLQPVIGKPAQLEAEAIDADPDAGAARERLREAEQALAKANARRNEAVQQDPDLKTARSRLESARQERVQTQRAIDSAQQDLIRAEQLLAAAAAAAAQAEQAQQRSLGTRSGQPRGAGRNPQVGPTLPK
jgi:chromosome segregation ATPase